MCCGHNGCNSLFQWCWQGRVCWERHTPSQLLLLNIDLLHSEPQRSECPGHVVSILQQGHVALCGTFCLLFKGGTKFVKFQGLVFRKSCSTFKVIGHRAPCPAGVVTSGWVSARLWAAAWCTTHRSVSGRHGGHRLGCSGMWAFPLFLITRSSPDCEADDWTQIFRFMGYQFRTLVFLHGSFDRRRFSAKENSSKVSVCVKGLSQQITNIFRYIKEPIILIHIRLRKFCFPLHIDDGVWCYCLWQHKES